MTSMPPSKMSVLVESAQCDKWGVFDLIPIKGEVHTAPIYKNGMVRIHHQLNMYCPCQPSIEYINNVTHILHNDLWS